MGGGKIITIKALLKEKNLTKTTTTKEEEE